MVPDAVCNAIWTIFNLKDISKLTNKLNLLSVIVQACGFDNDLGYGAIQLLSEFFCSEESSELTERALVLGFYA